MTVVAPERPGSGTGRHRRALRWRLTRLSGLAALAVALAAAAVHVALPSPERGPSRPGGPLTLATAWPKARVVDTPARLGDGTAFTPLHHLDAQTAVGTAPSPDRTAVRLLLRGADGTVRQLRALPERLEPQFGGFAAGGDDLVWAESTTGPDGQGETRIWRVGWRTSAAPVALTADTGDAVFFNSQYDLVIADAAVHWVAAARTPTQVTEVRSIPLTGGAVAVRRVDGAYALSTWPWLVSAGSGQTGPVTLRDLGSGATVAVAAPPTELVTCSNTWCRVLVLATTADPAQLELMRPDGTDRQKVAAGQVNAAISDVAVLDRFEVLAQAGRDGSPTSSQQLMLYDIDNRRTVPVATGVGAVGCRGGLLWWSTGDNETLTWHTLDLRTLT
ncbi:MAG TPA: hypothetical protein VFM55_00070 [Micromonosporaceae bacterium]|nr:hypothetical protein [Micromonosporaceae bacterium]